MSRAEILAYAFADVLFKGGVERLARDEFEEEENLLILVLRSPLTYAERAFDLGEGVKHIVDFCAAESDSWTKLADGVEDGL